MVFNTAPSLNGLAISSTITARWLPTSLVPFVTVANLIDDKYGDEFLSLFWCFSLLIWWSGSLRFPLPE